MFDFLNLFILAAKFSIESFSDPDSDPRRLRLQRIVLASTVFGTIVFAAGVGHILWFDFAGSLWVWLLIGGGSLWVVAGCIGKSLEGQKDRHSLPDGP